MKKNEKYVIDASMSDINGDGILCFCPVTDDGDIVTGLNYLGTDPNSGDVVGVWHPDGPDKARRWAEGHRADIERLTPRLAKLLDGEA